MFGYDAGLMLTGPKQVALVQAVLAPLLALTGFVLAGADVALGMFYGAIVALAASFSLVRRESLARRHPEWDGRKLIGVFMMTVLERLLIVMAMIGIGLGVLELAPLPVVAGLALAQAAWLTLIRAARNRAAEPPRAGEF